MTSAVPLLSSENVEKIPAHEAEDIQRVGVAMKLLLSRSQSKNGQFRPDVHVKSPRRRLGHVRGECPACRQTAMGRFQDAFRAFPGSARPETRRSQRFHHRHGLYRGRFNAASPYFFLTSVHTALIESVVVTLLALAVFGYIKSLFTTSKPIRSAWQAVLVGSIAATAAFVIAKSSARVKRPRETRVMCFSGWFFSFDPAMLGKSPTHIDLSDS